MSDNTKAIAFAQDLLLGGTSGILAKTACAPLERVKILLQVRQRSMNIEVILATSPIDNNESNLYFPVVSHL